MILFHSYIFDIILALSLRFFKIMVRESLHNVFERQGFELKIRNWFDRDLKGRSVTR